MIKNKFTIKTTPIPTKAIKKIAKKTISKSAITKKNLQKKEIVDTPIKKSNGIKRQKNILISKNRNTKKSFKRTNNVRLIVEAIEEKKGEKICIIDVTHINEAPAAYFVICEATTTIQLKAIADNIEAQLKKKLKERVFKRDLQKESTWMVLDYFDVIVHLFLPNQRVFYNLEDIWSDGIIEYIH